MTAEKHLEVRACLRLVRLSPYRGRLVARTLRGLSVIEAERRLEVMPQKAARLLLKTLRSAVANAKENYGASPAGLKVRRVLVDEGPKLRRLLPRARGRADIMRRPTAHLTVILEGAASSPRPKRREPPRRAAQGRKARGGDGGTRAGEKGLAKPQSTPPRLTEEEKTQRRPAAGVVRRFFRRKSTAG